MKSLEAQLAQARFFSLTNFQDFVLSFSWAQRIDASLQTSGLILMNSVQYDAVYRLNYDLPGTAAGTLSLFGSGLTRNAANHLTGGTVQALTTEFVAGTVRILQSRIENVSIDAVTLHGAMRTTDRADDIAVLRQMFRGNDVMTLSLADDYAFGHTGNDTLYGEGGDDRILGESGNDALIGGSGLDMLVGGAGIDRLFGGSDNDVLQSGSGNDQMKGDSGADFFEFRLGDGVDTVTDWTDGVDRIRLYGVTSASQISIVAVTGGDVRITALDFSVVVLNVDVEDFQLVRGTGLYALI